MWPWNWHPRSQADAHKPPRKCPAKSPKIKINQNRVGPLGDPVLTSGFGHVSWLRGPPETALVLLLASLPLTTTNTGSRAVAFVQVFDSDQHVWIEVFDEALGV